MAHACGWGLFGGVKRDDRAGVKDVGGKRERETLVGGFALTFTLAPQLMLRCCHFHHLKCCHFRCRSLAFAVGSRGVEGGKGERKSGNISILNKHNFVTLSPDYHGTPFSAFPNFLSPLCSPSL